MLMLSCIGETWCRHAVISAGTNITAETAAIAIRRRTQGLWIETCICS